MSTFDPVAEHRGLFVGYRLAQDMPGAELRLEWHGMPPRLLLRSLPWLVFLGALGVGAVLIWQFFGADIKLLLQGGGKFPIELAVVAFVVGGFMLFYIFPMLILTGRANGYWRSLAWDAGQNHFRGEFSKTPLIGRRTQTVPLSQIDKISFSIGPEGKGPVLIEMRLEFLGGREDIFLSIEVQHVDRRIEAMDLLFRIARIAKLPSYSILRNTHRRLDVTVMHTPDPADEETDLDEDELEVNEELAEKETEVEVDQEVADDEDEEDDEFDDDDFDYDWRPAVLPVPDDRSFARYEMNAPPVGFSEPQIEIPEFDPSQLAVDVMRTQVTCWEPGRNVRVHRPAWPLAACIGVPVAAGIAAGIVACWPAYRFVSIAFPVVVAPWIVFLMAAPVVASALFVYLWPRMRQREVVFDWEHRLVRWRDGSQVRELPLSAVQGLTLGGVRMSRSVKNRGGGSRTVHDYRAQVQMTLPESDEVIIETDNWDNDTHTPFQELLPFTVALARALGVPWNMADSPGAFGRRALALGRGRTILLIVAVLLATSLVGWHWLVRIADEGVARSARAEVERSGGKITFVPSRSFRNHELKNAWRVEFPEGIDDAKLIELAGPLSRIRRLDLDLSGQPITDAGVSALAACKYLVALDLSHTQAYHFSTGDFFRLDNLEIVDLSGTNVGERVSSLSMTNKLTVLVLDGTRVAYADLLHLQLCRSLKYVGVAGTAVTAEGAAKLRNLMPNVIVEGAK